MTKKRERRPASEWEELVSAWRTSGETQRSFAEARGLSASTLASWARKLKGGSAKSRKGRRPSVARKVAFSEVRVSASGAEAAQRASTTSPAVVQVTTPTGYTLRVMGTIDPAALRTVLNEVSRC